MARVARSDGAVGQDEAVLASIADSVRGTFNTVEDMTQSFIREAIVQGVFPPGHRLNLDLIAATLGVSRMPVRASLRQLEGEGLLQIHRYRGATVSVLRPHEIAEIYELRILLECFLVDNLMPRLDEDFLAELERLVSETEHSDELSRRLEARREFYQTLYSRADRPRAMAQVNNLRSSVGRYLLLQRVDEHHSHDELMALLRAGDAAAVKAWLTEHLSTVSAKLQQMVGAESE